MSESLRPVSVCAFTDQLSPEERSIFKSLICEKISEYFDEANNLSLHGLEEEDSFFQVASIIRYLTPFHEEIPINGVAYYGRPQWMNATLLMKLQAEALDRKYQKLDRTDHFLSCGGPVADALAINSEIVDFVACHTGKVVPTGIASYLYYDFAGGGIKPHVDTEVFSINMMLMLRHQVASEGESSSTVLFPPGLPPEYYKLQVGEVMLMYGSSTIHTRTMINLSEDIHLLTIGFNRR
ncbi:hypothetical protein [Chromobacterium sp. LK11]|uniref:hypothetical protein n=1 Tax=Chromobacterium sp. LK11 TaxID=1628212 RepID=UPI000A7938F3|nr:hypothetical protein [Chromobacterium sp. LK11]